PWLIRGDEWYQGLLRRLQPKSTTCVVLDV
ncbi:unnamed protein product, partial [Rotaria magnacalcarata]